MNISKEQIKDILINHKRGKYLVAIGIISLLFKWAAIAIAVYQIVIYVRYLFHNGRLTSQPLLVAAALYLLFQLMNAVLIKIFEHANSTHKHKTWQQKLQEMQDKNNDKKK